LRDALGASMDAREGRRRRTAVLWEQVSASQNEEERAELREEVVLLNMPVAQAIARRYASRGIPLDDLVQVACLGLVKAAKGFEPARERDFVSYAVPTISGEVKRYFRDLGWAVRPPRRVQDMQARINAVSADSVAAAGRDARPADVAALLGVEVSEVVEALSLSGAFTPSSLDVPVGNPGSSGSLGDLLASEHSDYEAVENTIVLRDAISTLAERDRLILQRRFRDGLTQQQIGAEVGLSQMQVSRTLARILAVLRGLVEDDSDQPLTA
jgi:RNA polymerase sigma-B factor